MRWRLNSSHYLNVPGTEWEYKEESRTAGRPIRQRINVPMLLDVNDPSMWNDKQNRWIIVCHEGKGLPSDIVFVGDPTPEMEPLDDEARELSNKFAVRWNASPETLGIGGYDQALIERISSQVEEQLKGNMVQPISQPVGDSQIVELKELVAKLSERIAQQDAIIAAAMQPAPTPSGIRRA